MTSDETQRRAFLSALGADPLDDATRSVFADWLDDHDEPEEADRMRRWRASYDWLAALAARGGVHCENYHAPYGDPGARPVSVADLIGAGYEFSRSGCGWAQTGDETLRDLAYGEGGLEDAFWRHWSAVTGEPEAAPDEGGSRAPFSCSC